MNWGMVVVVGEVVGASEKEGEEEEGTREERREVEEEELEEEEPAVAEEAEGKEEGSLAASISSESSLEVMRCWRSLM
jgi:hypothetical protein